MASLDPAAIAAAVAAARAAVIADAAARFVKVGASTLALGSVVANLAARWFMLRARRWRLSEDTARNVFVYVMELAVTTAALAVSCATLRALFADSSLLVREESTMACLGVVLGALGAIYITELNFKPRLGWPLAFHHVSTIAMGIYLAVFFQELVLDGAADAATATAASLVIMSLTEQCVFVGLLARRGEAHGVARCVPPRLRAAGCSCHLLPDDALTRFFFRCLGILSRRFSRLASFTAALCARFSSLLAPACV